MNIPVWIVYLFPVVVLPATIALFNLRTRVTVIESQIDDNDGFKQLVDKMDRRLVTIETIIIEMRRKS